MTCFFLEKKHSGIKSMNIRENISISKFIMADTDYSILNTDYMNIIAFKDSM